MGGWEELTWDLPLETPPQVVAIGRNAHGFDPVDVYCLPDLWSLHVYGYTAELRLDGRALPIRPGYVGITAPGTQMEYRYTGISVHLYAHFRAGTGAVQRLRAMQDVGERFDALYGDLFSVAGQTGPRTDARVWDILWSLISTTHSAERPPLHPAVVRATRIIERNLSEPLTVGGLAREAEVSPGHLVRLFREAFDDTVVGYLRRRRMEQAQHLLQRSTLPIKVIAATVGIPDLQHFNKAVRAHFGASPRALREGTSRSDV